MKIYTSIILIMLIQLSSCGEPNKKKDNEVSTPPLKTEINADTYQQMLDKGQKVAIETKTVLGKNLLSAINKRGTAGAIGFCSEKAIHLTDSTGNSNNVIIKRVSDLNRNPSNQANESELKYIGEQKRALSNEEKIKPEIHLENGKYIGYYPILTSSMCLQCHGKKNKHILPETAKVLNNLYPHDKATGYEDNELRGIWVVEMEASIDK